MDNFIDNNFTKYAENAKISWILPSIGVAMGLGNHLIQRKDMDPDGRFRSLMRSMLLGGMAGTGAEMMRIGGLNFLNRIGDDHQVPENVSGWAIPRQGKLWGAEKLGRS